MPLELLKRAFEYYKRRKPMKSERKKGKKGTHYANPKGVDADSVIGKARARNKSVQEQLDQLD